MLKIPRFFMLFSTDLFFNPVSNLTFNHKNIQRRKANQTKFVSAEFQRQ